MLLSMVAPGCLAGPPAAPADNWFRCEADTDCVHIRYACAEGVVNKAFAQVANDDYALANARMNCVASVPPGPDKGASHKGGKDIPYKVYCEARQCKVRGADRKMPGFS